LQNRKKHRTFAFGMKQYKVWLDSDNIYVEDESGAVASKRIADYPALLAASPAEREAFELSPCGVHWFDLDVDLLSDSFYNPEKYNLWAMPLPRLGRVCSKGSLSDRRQYK